MTIKRTNKHSHPSSLNQVFGPARSLSTGWITPCNENDIIRCLHKRTIDMVTTRLHRPGGGISISKTRGYSKVHCRREGEWITY